MHRLYKEYGTYTAVANEVGRSPSTVAKYLKLENLPANIKILVVQGLK